MDNVECGNDDTVLLACSYDPNTSEDSHGEDAGIRCKGECFIAIHIYMYKLNWERFICDTFCWEQLPALMEMFIWLVAHHMKGEWRCVLMEDGEQSVITSGVKQMLKLCADS